MSYKINYQYEIDSMTGCWFVNSHKPHSSGYVYVNRKYHKGYLHRILYENEFGEIPAGSKLQRTCGDKSCVNPEHLSISRSNLK